MHAAEATLLLNRAAAHLAAGQPLSAIDDCKVLLAREPNNAKALFR